MAKPRLLQKKSTYTIDYPAAIEFATTQQEIFWLPDEIEVEKDLHDMKTNFNEAEYHGVITTLKLFTLYELSIGAEYWSGYVTKLFPRPDIQRMANCFSFFELNVHAPFYNKLNEVLGLNTDAFYTEYLDDPILKNRMEWIEKKCVIKDRDSHYDILKSLAVFSMIEGAILYSSFAFLLHFQAQGKNKLINVNSGINFSVKDENIHSIAGAWLFRTFLAECEADGFDRHDELYGEIYTTAKIIMEHEEQIISKIFEKGNIKGITDLQLNNFVESRLDICLQEVGLERIFKPKHNPIDKWFYKMINSGKLHDFFVKQGNEYNRAWTETKFTWNPPTTEEEN